MAEIRSTLLIAFLSLPLMSIGCDKIKDLISSKSWPVAQIQTKQLSIESILDRVIAKDQADVAREHKEGKTATVGAVDGKEWLESSLIDMVISEVWPILLRYL